MNYYREPQYQGFPPTDGPSVRHYGAGLRPATVASGSLNGYVNSSQRAADEAMILIQPQRSVHPLPTKRGGNPPKTRCLTTRYKAVTVTDASTQPPYCPPLLSGKRFDHIFINQHSCSLNSFQDSVTPGTRPPHYS